MVGHSGAAISILGKEHPDATIRMSTVQCGLQRTLKGKFSPLLPLFTKESHVVGHYVYVVGG